jgi:iron complex outermembrane receptor protein
MRIVISKLKSGGSIAALAISCLAATPSIAQSADSSAADGGSNAPAQVPEDTPPLAGDEDLAAPQSPASDAQIEEIVVTGTNIRGAATVGSNLIAVGREAIDDTAAQTVQQILRSVPAITGQGATPQGQNPSSYYMPTIHSLGASSSNSTLVLIDGHRFSPGGQQQTLVDPNIIPPIALERVEVLAEGASSVYGSDAVAGVVNFITRSGYDGLMVTGQLGFGDEYRTYNAGLLWGERWNTGSVMLAYNFSNRSGLSYADRDFARPDHRLKGGTNFSSFSCSPATIQPGGSGPIYLSPTATSPVDDNSANAPCDNTIYNDYFPEETRHNLMVKLEKEVGANLDVGLDLVYSNRANTQRVPRGDVTATVFRTGPQANPFYVNPPGVAEFLPNGDPNPAFDSQTIRFSADELLGEGARNYDDAINYYIAADFEYRIGDNFRLTGLGLYGREDSFVGDEGELCGSCASLALNGTTNSGGSLTRPSIPGTDIIIGNLPLTEANALDVWSPVGSNRTSPEVLRRLVDNRTTSRWYYSIKQARLAIDGALFDLPAGPVRSAVGVEYVYYDLDINRTRPNNTGPSSSGSEFFHLYLERNVKSAYGELLIPIIGPENDVPFVRNFEINLSGRYDHYSDTDSTTNPRIAASWEVVDGFRVRGNWSKSFVAPQLTSYGDRSRGGLTSFSGYGATSGTLIVPIANFPLAAQLPGCTAPGQVTCTITGATPGISLNGSPADPQPGRGTSWSVGIDLAPVALPGFRASATLFNTKLRNQITGTSASNAINSEALNSNLQIFPDGATADDIRAVAGDFPQTSPLPPTIFYILSVRQQNVLNLDIQGIDASVNYEMETDAAGMFTVGGSITHFTKFDQFIGGPPTFSVLNQTGFNNTFPSIQTQARANIGWEYSGFSANLFANYVGSYRNWSGSTVIPVEIEDGVPVGGGDKVEASTIFDLNLAYTIPDSSALNGSQIFMDVTNLFDKDPVFYNNANGFDRFSGNPIGRVVTIGFRTTF